jgi:hypothetical protein
MTGTIGEESPEIPRAGFEVLLAFGDCDSVGSQRRLRDRKSLFIDGSRLNIVGFEKDTDFSE